MLMFPKSQNYVVRAERGQEMQPLSLVINWLGFLVISSLETTITYGQSALGTIGMLGSKCRRQGEVAGSIMGELVKVASSCISCQRGKS